jgi:hypothetical protein
MVARVKFPVVVGIQSSPSVVEVLHHLAALNVAGQRAIDVWRVDGRVVKGTDPRRVSRRVSRAGGGA